MSLYKRSDVDLLGQNFDSIMETITKKKLELFEPTGDEKNKVMKTILTYIKQYKRKIYGGFALNALIVDRDPTDAIYKDYDTPDVDFYSPEPIQDLIKLCNILQDAGFKYVNGKEAMHKETYSIYVNYALYCDISYVPRNIYNKMPFKEIKGIFYIHPNFMTIDYLRMMTDPLISYWRIDKAFKRFYLLQKHYPLPHNENPIEISGSNDKIDYALDTVYEFVKSKKNCIVIGFYAYNYYLNESGILSTKSKANEKFALQTTPYYEIISSNYRDDARDLIDALKLKFPSGGIKHVENYPFFQFTGFNVTIYLEDEILAVVYHNNGKCLPFFNVNAVKYVDGKAVKDTGTITVGTFSLTILYALITIMKARVDENTDIRNLYTTLISHLIEARNFFFTKEKKTIFDKTPFREFVIECIGETMMPEREKRLIIEHRKKKNQRYIYNYDPSSEKREPAANFVFANSSGNPIRKDRNLKLSDDKHDISLEGDDADTDEDVDKSESSA
jgi:hypothetical protein